MKYYDTDEQLHFLEACSEGDRLEVEKLLRSGDINFQHGINKWTALHWAAKRGHENLCNILLKAGFSPEERDSQDRIPYDICNPENTAIRNLLKPSDNSIEMHEVEQQKINGNKFTPGYIKNSNFPYFKQSSVDSSSNPSSPTTRGYYSYGRRDSATRTRFLLVRTSCAAGKEAYKRITLPGGSTVEGLKKTVENAMKAGSVQSLMTLPDNVLIEEESQIEAFGNCQKIDVVFGEPLTIATPNIPAKTLAVRRTSLMSQARDDTPETSESLSMDCGDMKTTTAVLSHSEPIPDDSSKMNGGLDTPPPSPSNESEVLHEEKEEPAVEDLVLVTADFHFKKENRLDEATESISLSNTDQEIQDISEETKKWTTAQQVAAVAAAASLVGLGCYIYKLRK